MAINKKLITFATKEKFLGATGINNATKSTNGYYGNIPSASVVFIVDTGEIWTHGKYYSGGVWGTKTNNYVPFTVAGTTYNVSLDGHTHSYLPLSGGTITSSSFGPLIIKRTDTTNGASIQYKGSSNVYGYIGFNAAAKDK